MAALVHALVQAVRFRRESLSIELGFIAGTDISILLEAS